MKFTNSDTGEKFFVLQVHPDMIKALELTAQEKWKLKQHSIRFIKRYEKEEKILKGQLGVLKGLKFEA